MLVQSEDHWVRPAEDIRPTAAPNDDIPRPRVPVEMYRDVYADLNAEYVLEIRPKRSRNCTRSTATKDSGDEATMRERHTTAQRPAGRRRGAGADDLCTVAGSTCDERFDRLSKRRRDRAGDIDGPGEPEPDIYERGATELGVAPEDCWAVEDSTAGARAAVAAGMTTVGFRGDGDETDLSMVHETADDAASLRQVL